jgi:hypothetical protein
VNAGNKYSRLKEFLTATTKDESMLSLAELENVLGFPLPDSARVQFRGIWERLGTVAKPRTGITCLFVRSHGEFDETS